MRFTSARSWGGMCLSRHDSSDSSSPSMAWLLGTHRGRWACSPLDFTLAGSWWPLPFLPSLPTMVAQTSALGGCRGGLMPSGCSVVKPEVPQMVKEAMMWSCQVTSHFWGSSTASEITNLKAEHF